MADSFDEHRRQTFGEFVHDEKVRAGYECTANGEHLLLPTR